MSPRHSVRRPLFAEQLEDRCTPAAFNVTTAADAGAGSLRQAITDANAAAGADTITFDPGLSGQTINLATSLPAIADSVTITGPTAAGITVSGQDVAGVRPFDVAVTAAVVTISNLTITRGNPNAAADDGGGLRNAGPNTTLNNVVVTLNKAGRNGGGVANGGTLTLNNSVISTNTAVDDGGGIENTAAAAVTTVTGSTVTGNTAGNTAGNNGGGLDTEGGGTLSLTDTNVTANKAGDNGGGFELRNGATVTITRCTVSGNQAQAGGNGGGFRITSGTVTVTNTTVVGNTSGGSGGGFSIIGGTVTIVNNTVTTNTDTSAVANRSGGISAEAGSTVTLANSVVAQNTTSDTVARDVRGTFAAGSNNNFLTFVDANTNLTNGTNGNVVGADPQLAALGFNGGSTQTRLPLPGSPLINAGSNAAVPPGTTLDQRGALRLVGTVDVGAVEVQRPTPLAASGAAGGQAQLFAPGAGGTFAAAPTATVAPFGALGGNVRAATGDVNGDGFPDTVLVTGPGTPIRLAVISGADNTTVLVTPFDPFGGDFTGGGFVAAGDFDRDGKEEFLVTPDQGGGPRVTIFTLAGGAVTQKANFFGIDDPAFRGGCRAAVGDVNRDGTPDLAVAAGFLGGPRTALFDGKTAFTGNPTRLVGDFFAFPGTDAVNLRNGVFVALGDVDGDGFADLIFGGGPGGAPRVFILSGALVSANNVLGAQGVPVANFFVAGNSADRGGVRVAALDADGDNRADVVAGSGEGSPARARVYLGKNFTTAGEPATFQDLTLFGGGPLPGGVFVG